jgi:NAD(P)-dependent dehydrogenase (short-subunit alcohol dehydrogenase family)
VDLKNNRVVVVGGSSGIGRATADLLTEYGAEVITTGRSPDKPATEHVDATDRSALNAMFERIGPVDHLVVCVSGGEGAGPFATLSLDAVRRAFEAKTLAQLETIQAALPTLRPGGSVTLVTAASAQAALPGTVGLAAVNGALESAVRPLASELAPVRVNAVSPGVVDTAWWGSMPEADRGAFFAAVSGNTPLGRVARPEEIATTIAMLVASPYVTGQVVVADGGMSLAR